MSLEPSCAKNLFDRDMLAEKWVDSVMVASPELLG